MNADESLFVFFVFMLGASVAWVGRGWWERATHYRIRRPVRTQDPQVVLRRIHLEPKAAPLEGKEAS